MATTPRLLPDLEHENDNDMSIKDLQTSNECRFAKDLGRLTTLLIDDKGGKDVDKEALVKASQALLKSLRDYVKFAPKSTLKDKMSEEVCAWYDLYERP